MNDGNICFIGRNDSQVKIQGFRIEIGEIEAKLVSYPSISNAIVIPQEHQAGTKYLVAYYVADSVIDEKLIKDFLESLLPEYMVPSVFVYMKKLPITTNGKINVKLLPPASFIPNNAYVAPKNDFERKICEIYSSVLKMDSDKISINDDFFRLGGNSILAIRVINRINSDLRMAMTIPDLYKYRSIHNIVVNKNQWSEFRLVNKLNFSSFKEPLFMIHPGGAGSEVYVGLSKLLNYTCYGIDYYNLYNNSDMITRLDELANKYLEGIKVYFQNTAINLLGWSLGGMIALQMAYILENSGFMNINVYLLDTIINDGNKQFIELKKKANCEYMKLHIDKMSEDEIRFNLTEEKLSYEYITGKLKTTRVVLFKAMKSDINLSTDMNEYIRNLKYNNIEYIVSS